MNPALIFLLISLCGSSEEEFFEGRIRPILQRRCMDCHGDEEMGGLRLDSRGALLVGGSSGPAVLPGDPDRSLLIRAIRHEVEPTMPWRGERLLPEEIKDLEEWVRSGAHWPDSVVSTESANLDPSKFWSFQPLRSPQPPTVEDDVWPTTSIDQFILGRLEAEGLAPVAPATRTDWLRRVTFDLTGLPPAADEIEAFLADHGDDADSKVIDRLLESPHHGERWGRHWLDVVRFGEDDARSLAEDDSGIERYHSAYLYRDWVIQAINEDLPFDDFLRAQLAADLLQEELGRDSLAALGFLGAGPWYYDNAEPVLARADERHDRIDVTTRGFLGITVACARCHDHKYDPFTMQDYYGLAGVFASSEYHEFPLGPELDHPRIQSRLLQLERVREELGDFLSEERWQLSRGLTWQIERYMIAAWKVSGEPQLELEQVVEEDRLDRETLVRWIKFLERQPRHYPFLTAWQAMIERGGDQEEARELAGEFQDLVLRILADSEELEDHNEYLIAHGSPPPEQRKSIPLPNGFESVFDFHDLELKSQPREEVNLLLDLYVRDLDTAGADRRPGLLRYSGWRLERHLSQASLAHIKSLRQRVEELEAELKGFRIAMGVQDLPQERIADLALPLRGDSRTTGGSVPRRFIAALSADEPRLFQDGSGRGELADCIARHPLASRVIVNRVWRWHFGTGLVETPGNFGATGERPSHPELLEFLATWFETHGRSLKALHREILRSSVYRLSSAADAELLQRDPGNRLYGRFSPRRLEAECIRDAMLAASGQLDRTCGGGSFALGEEDNHRRTVYATVSRCQLDPFLSAFDFPDPAISCQKRFSTTVPMQGLFFLNNAFVHSQADALATRLLEEGRGLAEAIQEAHLLLFGRPAEEEEVRLGLQFLQADATEVTPGRWSEYARALFASSEFRILR